MVLKVMKDGRAPTDLSSHVVNWFVFIMAIWGENDQELPCNTC